MPTEPPSAHPFLRVLDLRCTLSALGPVQLPDFMGTTLRGGLGQAFRRLACTTRSPSCDGCAFRRTCAYAQVWEPLPPPDAPKRFASPPRPYVVEVPAPATPTQLAYGDPLSFNLKLFGSASQHWPFFVLAVRDAAFEGLGRQRGRLRLETVHPSQQPLHLLFTPTTGLNGGPDPLRIDTAPPAKAPSPCLRLDFCTPLHLKDNSRHQPRFDPVTFTARLADRLDLLTALYEDDAPRLPFVALREAAAKVQVIKAHTAPVKFKRFSSRAGAVPMAGISGAVDLAGVAPELFALWRCAAYIHVGKQAVFGFGQVRLSELPRNAANRSAATPPG